LGAFLAAVLWPFAAAQAQNTISVGGATVMPGQAEVVVPISATTTGQLTGLDAVIDFDAELCKRIENQQIRMAGRTEEPPQEGVRCPEVGRLALVLFNLSGDPVLPAGEGVIAEWVFSVRPDAAGGTFPLDLVVNQARNGPLRVTLNVEGEGEIAIDGPTVTPTTLVDTPTITPTPEDTATPPPTFTSTATPTFAATNGATNTATATATATASATPSADATATNTTVPPRPCVGDCNGNGEVTINELILGVNIALGNAPVSACEAFDCQGTGMVPINCLVQGVNNASNGCPASIDIGPIDLGPRG
jgi:hypothetical protein